MKSQSIHETISLYDFGIITLEEARTAVGLDPFKASTKQLIDELRRRGDLGEAARVYDLETP